MPRQTPAKSEPWKHGYRVEGRYYISRTIAGKRVRIATGLCTEAAALAEYAKFELNPAGYVSPLGKRAFTRKRRGSASDPVRAAQLRENHHARAYALLPVEYAALLAQQGGRCAICGVLAAETKGATFDVDHDHRTGATRGLLCGPCNRGIGSLGDSPELLERAAAYLRERAPAVSHPQPTTRI